MLRTFLPPLVLLPALVLLAALASCGFSSGGTSEPSAIYEGIGELLGDPAALNMLEGESSTSGSKTQGAYRCSSSLRATAQLSADEGTAVLLDLKQRAEELITSSGGRLEGDGLSQEEGDAGDGSREVVADFLEVEWAIGKARGALVVQTESVGSDRLSFFAYCYEIL